jgi:hypothetical protein
LQRNNWQEHVIRLLFEVHPRSERRTLASRSLVQNQDLGLLPLSWRLGGSVVQQKTDPPRRQKWMFHIDYEVSNDDFVAVFESAPSFGQPRRGARQEPDSHIRHF